MQQHQYGEGQRQVGLQVDPVRAPHVAGHERVAVPQYECEQQRRRPDYHEEEVAPDPPQVDQQQRGQHPAARAAPWSAGAAPERG
ncbi:hypothetical protein, partial [Allosalinactinospora lopnorensis]|uniref:hypothetical protein n=1 Tax=Allosalinactinospora lopnorensis TaxID=1352348 RepID=UPI0012E0F6A8